MVDLNHVARETLALRAYEQRVSNISVIDALAAARVLVLDGGASAGSHRGRLAHEAVLRAPADGHTIGFSGSGFIINSYLYKMPFKTSVTFTYDSGEFEKGMIETNQSSLVKLRLASRRTSAWSCVVRLPA